ncbi:AAA family ATPase [Thermaerobacter litoralis]
MKIRRIRLQNFQAHEDTSLDLAPGLTVLVGPSDSGKSAVLRALRWVYLNQPAGLEILRAGASQVRVDVELEDGTRVIRERSSATNRYVIERPGQEPEVIEGFGRDVPAPVLDVLGIRPVHLGGKAIWLGYAGQLEPPFLLSEAGAVQAEAIGRLTGVHVLGQAAVAVRRDEQSAEREGARLGQDIAELEAELAAYADLPEEEARVRTAEALVAAAQARNDRAERLGRLAREHAAVLQSRQEADTALARLAGVPAAEAVMARAQTLEARRQKLLSLAAGLDEAVRAQLEARDVLARTAGLPVAERLLAALGRRTERLARLRQIAEAWEDLVRQRSELAEAARQWARVEPAAQVVAQADALARRLERLRPLAVRWQELAGERAALERQIEQARAVAARAEQAYQQTLARLGVCPTCGQPIRTG